MTNSEQVLQANSVAESGDDRKQPASLQELAAERQQSSRAPADLTQA